MVKAKKGAVKQEQAAKPEKQEKKQETQETKADELKYQVQLGTQIKKTATVGRNKCGMAWKKESKRSQFHKGVPSKYEKRMVEKERLKRIKDKMAELKNSRSEKKRLARERTKEKAERKKINEFKSSTYQVVSIHSLYGPFTMLIQSDVYRSQTWQGQRSGTERHVRPWPRCQQKHSTTSSESDTPLLSSQGLSWHLL